jgi:hypothetical protein
MGAPSDHCTSVLRDLHVVNRFRRQAGDRKYGSIHQAKLCSGTAMHSSSYKPTNIQQEDMKMKGRELLSEKKSIFLV